MKEKTVYITENSGLVLEGGGMRGIFTNGVLDNFMDRGIAFPYIVGVSAGACNALSYLSNQRGRAKYINTDLLKERNYIGFKYLLLEITCLACAATGCYNLKACGVICQSLIVIWIYLLGQFVEQ